MTLIDQITNWLRRLRPDRDDSAQPTSYEQSRSVNRLYEQFADARNRREVIQIADQMYHEDTRAQAVIDRPARAAVRRGFTLSVNPVDGDGAAPDQSEQAQAILQALVERLKLTKRSASLIQRAMRHGDLFLQTVADSQNRVVALVAMPTLEMNRNSNDLDCFDDPRFAYWQNAQAYTAALTPPMREGAGVTWFADWQIIHARWQHDENQRYGRPDLAAARGAYKRFREGEIDMAVRRKTRAGLRYVHKVDGSEADIAQYRAQNQDALSDPFAAVSDFFGNVEISTLQGDARLSELDDVVHHLDAFFAGSPLPMALLGYGRDVNRDVLRDQYAEYLRALDEIAAWFEDQVLMPLFELELMLHGVLPESLAVTVQWAEKDEVSFTIEDWEKLVASGKLSDETLLRLLQRAMPEFDAEAEIETIQSSAALRMPGDAEALLQMLRAGSQAGSEDNAGAEETTLAQPVGLNGRAHV